MRNIYLTGYKNKNLGDDLFFITILNRYKNTKFIFEDIPSGYYKDLFNGFDNIEVLPYIVPTLFDRIINKITRVFNKGWMGQYYSSYQKKNKIIADAYLKVGGSVFIEPKKNKSAIKKRFIADKKYFGDIPFFYFGCNYGPFTSSYFFRNSEFVIRNCSSICFRDNFSYSLFKKYKHVRLAPDILFGIIRVFKGLEKKPNSIGFSLMDLSVRANLKHYYHSYIEGLSSFLKKNYYRYEIIRFFSFCEPEGDVQAINDVLNLLPAYISRKVDVVQYDGDYCDLLSKFSELEYMVSTRFHAMILGLVYGIKTVPIVYSPKITEVLYDIGRNIPTLELHHFSCDSLVTSLDSSRVIDVQTQVRDSLFQFEDFDHFIE